MIRLTWAQEVPSSNLGAPTKCIQRIFFSLSKVLFTQNFAASPLILEISFRLNIQEYRPKERKFRNY